MMKEPINRASWHNFIISSPNGRVIVGQVDAVIMGLDAVHCLCIGNHPTQIEHEIRKPKTTPNKCAHNT
jgi:hypothetical protein